MGLRGVFSLRHRMADERTERSLRAVVRGSAYLCLTATLLIGYSLWSVHRALAHEQSESDRRRKQMGEIAAALKEKPGSGDQAASLRTSLPQERGSTEFAAEVSRQAQLSAVRVTDMRLSDGGDTETVPPDGAATNGDETSEEDTPEKDTANADWQGAPFELILSGSYRNLSAFLEGLAVLPRVVELGQIELSRSGLETSGKGALLKMRVTGQFFGLPAEAAETAGHRTQVENASKRP